MRKIIISVITVFLIFTFVVVRWWPYESVDLPEHLVSATSLSPKEGQRVQINVTSDISRQECEGLIAKYHHEAAPDGQVSVRKPSSKLGNRLLPWCVDNFDGKGIFFNDVFFNIISK